MVNVCPVLLTVIIDVFFAKIVVGKQLIICSVHSGDVFEPSSASECAFVDGIGWIKQGDHSVDFGDAMLL